MLTNDPNELPPEVLYTSLNAMYIDIGEFMYRPLNDHPKEVLCYAEIYSRYQEHKKYPCECP